MYKTGLNELCIVHQLFTKHIRPRFQGNRSTQHPGWRSVRPDSTRGWRDLDIQRISRDLQDQEYHVTWNIMYIAWPAISSISGDLEYHVYHVTWNINFTWSEISRISGDLQYHVYHVTCNIKDITWPEISRISRDLKYQVYHVTRTIKGITWP